MSNNIKVMSKVLIFTIICSMFLIGCGTDKDEESETEVTTTAEGQIKENNSLKLQTSNARSTDDGEKDYLEMLTSIAYSTGDTKNWTYGNQRKEFTNNKSCYVRVGITAKSTNLFGKGKGDTVTVTYRFTGTDNCPVQVSDGKATEVNTGDSNVTEFSHIVTVSKKWKAPEDVMIFRYSPNGAESVILEVIYDDQIAEKYDAYNTIYFDKLTDTH